MTTSPRITQTFDSDAITDAMIWARAERLFMQKFAKTGMPPSTARAIWHRGAGMSVRMLYWDDAFWEMFPGGGR